ncbi:unnamed protein product [Phytomonas sp. Hart1]|nr:unnamed protein product [Phytomonas sp. Hart1]|eukprot:CCW70135.1 unnamed protein product [Phytomonas sp. isolate Hart1]
MQSFTSQFLTSPVSIDQIREFTPQLVSQQPTFRLSDGTIYYGEVDRLTGLPQGQGIALFKFITADTGGNANRINTMHPNSPSAVSSSAPMELPWNTKKNLLKAFRVYRTDDRYGGQWENGQFHGEGVLLTSTFSYQGNWKDGHMHGTAIIQYERNYVDYYPKGENDTGMDMGVSTLFLRGLSYLSPFEDTTTKPKEYIGEMEQFRLRHGFGMMRYYNGDVYQGNWVNNRRHGNGKFLKSDGEIYEGMWERDERHGAGTIQYIDGNCFKGMLEHNLRSGEGMMIFTNGDQYYGNFAKNHIDGHGTMRFKNGDVYVGHWRDGIRHGDGKYTLKRKGVIVRGNFNKGLIEGNGTVEHPDVSLFVGVFERGERIKGTLFWISPSVGDVVGEEKGAKNEDSTPISLFDGVMGGAPSAPHSLPPASPQTQIIFSVGKKCYQGEWVGENMHGKGLLWYFNGDFYYGFFKNNKRHGPGNMRHIESGSEYSGNFVEDKQHGFGVEQAADGLIKAGWWENDEFVEGYHGEWNGSELHGVGRMRLAVETFLYHDCKKVYQKRGASASLQTSAIMLMDFFGIFQNGLRHGEGILKLPFISFRLDHNTTSAEEERRYDLYGPYSSEDDLTADARLNMKRKHPKSKDSARLSNGFLPRYHVIKACWVNDVLESNHSVWAFPSGEVYCGPLSKGVRAGSEGRLWIPNGSVYVGPWRENLPYGEGLFYAKNTLNPIYTLQDLNSKKTSNSSTRNNNPNLSCTLSANSLNGADSSVRDLVFGLWGALPSAENAFKNNNEEINDIQRTEQQPLQHVLVDYRDDYVLIGRWNKHMLPIATYKEHVVPQLNESAGIKRIASLVDSTQSQVIVREYESLVKGKSAVDPSQIASIKIPSSIPVGVHTGLSNVLYTSGVWVQTFFIGNYPMLVTPYIPGSAFDHHLQRLHRDEILPKDFSVPSHTSFFTESLRAVMEESKKKINLFSPDMKTRNVYNNNNASSNEPVEDDSSKKSLFEMEANIAGMGINMLTASNQYMQFGDQKETTNDFPSTPVNCCTFCKKAYNFFRSPKPCKLCLRSSCTSCLLPMELTSSRKPDIDALIARSLILHQRALQHSKNQTLNPEVNFDVYRNLSAQGITSVSVCVDCSLSVMLGIQTNTLWIPMPIIHSVLFPTSGIPHSHPNPVAGKEAVGMPPPHEAVPTAGPSNRPSLLTALPPFTEDPPCDNPTLGPSLYDTVEPAPQWGGLLGPWPCHT